jgi:NAD(P)-dependent dehydrogenase (short-subunit alcohol dehydrogenase family)/peptidoglycan/xylan/chitin deacetylase (PgdA/CDA1 family)
LDFSQLCISDEEASRLFSVNGDLCDEESVKLAFQRAYYRFGPPQILIANAGITDESNHPNIWEIEAAKWDKVNAVNVRGTFLTIKHFLLAVKRGQESLGQELENVSIVITGSETGVFGQEGHAEYASGKAGLQYGLVRTVKNEIVRLNAKGRVNAVAPGWINTPLIGDRLDDPRERWAESEATVALRKIAEPKDVAGCMAFLASHKAAGHISGQCVSIDGGQEGRLLWREVQAQSSAAALPLAGGTISFAVPTPPKRQRKMRICLSIDFDAISSYLGTGHTPQNTLADYSAGLFGANVGVGRVLKLLQKYNISERVTWFVPGHTMESFPRQTAAIVDSGAEIGLHGYSHESAYAMTPEQERDVLEKCIKLAKNLTGKHPVGYRAPLYQVRASTIRLLQENGFSYDSSMNAHDSMPYLLPRPFPDDSSIIPDYGRSAESWMVPTIIPNHPEPGAPAEEAGMVEIPGSWYTEDITPLGFFPYSESTHGYISVEVVEKMWWDRFEWLWENECWLDGENLDFGSIYPLIWHPECVGRSHIVGMIDRFIGKLVAKMNQADEGEIIFETMESVARSWRRIKL